MSFVLLSALSIFCCASCASQSGIVETAASRNAALEMPPSRAEKSFVLGPGDELTLSVWRHDDLNRNMVVDPSGEVSVPLAGPMKASGQTIPQLREAIVEKLSHYLVNPQVNLGISSISSRRVYVLGEVYTPQALNLNRDMQVWEAIASVGGFNHDANERHVLLIRQGEDGPTAYVLDLQMASLAAGTGGVVPYLEPKDIVYVPPKTIADVERFMNRLNSILGPFISAERTVILGDDAWRVLTNRRESREVIIAQ